jgi:hypothetical protein
MGAQATLNPVRLSVAPGGEAHADISVKNIGQVVDAFTLQVLGDAAGWTACEPRAISLLPGQDGTARIMIRPPLSPDLPYGPVPFAVRVASTEDPPGSVVEEGLLDVGGMPQVTADLSPRTGRSRGMRASRHRIAVDNYGNAPALIALAGTDDADTVEVTVRPPELEVAPGGAALADVRVRARRRFWRGPAVTHRFQVTALPPGGDPIRTDGSLLQEAALPSWLPKAIALTLAAAVAAAALWLAVLRPAVQNAAASAGTAAAQQAVHQAFPSGLPTSGGSGGGATPTPTPTPTPTQASAPKHKAPAPVPITQALSTASPTVTAPPKRTLAITDVVFQNPAGDQGTLKVNLSGQTLFSEQLANFRDYDLHFITPITVPAGQSLSLSVACSNSGGKPCTPVVLLSGTQNAG